MDRPSCSDRKRQAGKEKVQVLSDRLLPHRHRRSADRRGKALPLRGDRQNFEVRLRPTCQKSQSCYRIGLPGRLGQKPFPTKSIRCSPNIQFRLPPRQANGPNAPYMTHMFALRCREHGIEHRFTKINHPWTNGQVERMNRTIKNATVKRYHYDDHDQLRRHLADFVAAYNFARRLKTLKGLTPFEFVSKCWTSEPDRFKLNPLHQMPGLNT